MSRSSKIFGTCHICGKEADLSFEHLPPKAALNNKRVKVVTMEDRLSNTPGKLSDGVILQRGLGKHSLCSSCNSLTGAWYAKELIAATSHASKLLAKFPITHLDQNPDLLTFPLILKNTHPLRLLKQIVTMLLSVNKPIISKNHPDLVSFVLNRDKRKLPDRYAFYLSFFGGPSSRIIPLTNFFHFASRTQMNIAELAYSPFVYTMNIDSVRPPLPCGNISSFKEFEIDNKTDLELRLPIAFTHTPIPADYRSKAAIGDEIAPWKVL